MSRHRKPAPPKPVTPLLTAGAALACLWAPLATSPATASEVVTAPVGPPAVERTSVLRRATRSPQHPPVWVVAVRVALAQLGVKYQWGAKNPTTGGVDCSGLTQWAWMKAGVRIGADTYSQIGEGVPVTQVQPGDLIFPAAEFGPRGPGHVQLAISATQVVEAPGRGMTVRVVPMPAHYVARRVA